MVKSIKCLLVLPFMILTSFVIAKEQATILTEIVDQAYRVIGVVQSKKSI